MEVYINTYILAFNKYIHIHTHVQSYIHTVVVLTYLWLEHMQVLGFLHSFSVIVLYLLDPYPSENIHEHHLAHGLVQVLHPHVLGLQQWREDSQVQAGVERHVLVN